MFVLLDEAEQDARIAIAGEGVVAQPQGVQTGQKLRRFLAQRLDPVVADVEPAQVRREFGILQSDEFVLRENQRSDRGVVGHRGEAVVVQIDGDGVAVGQRRRKLA